MANSEIAANAAAVNMAEHLDEPKDLSVYVPETVQKPGEVAFNLMWVLFGVLGYYFAMDMTSDTYSSPSVFPKFASVIIIFCAGISLFKAVKRAKPAEGETAIKYLLPRDVAVIIGMVAAYCFALPVLHFIPASYIFLVAGMVYLHRGKKILQSCIYSAIALAVLVLVFRFLFLVILP